MNNRCLPLFAAVHRFLWLLACCQYLVLSLPVSSKNLDLAPATITWSPEISRHLFSPNRKMNVLPYTSINIVCPNMGNAPELDEDKMYENIWTVEKKGFDACAVDVSSHLHLFLHCNKPSVLTFGRISFDPAAIDGSSYEPGKTYYLIATSNGSKSSLNNTAGGNCLSQNMKIAFYVCRDRTDPKCLRTSTKRKECNTDKPKRMKKVFRKMEFLSQILNNSSKQLTNLMDHSNDMEGKIDAILENLNSTQPGIKRDVV